MKVLVLGATGQVGSALMTTLAENNVDCVGLGRENIELTHPDEVQDAIKKHEPDVVVNSVALQAIDTCERYPTEAFAVNATAVLHLANLCRKQGLTLMQLSTHTVFDGKKLGYYTEKDMACPLNVYGASKYSGECFTSAVCDKHYIIRLPTMFGGRNAGYKGIIDKILGWINAGKPLWMATDKIDSFGYTKDAAETMLQLLNHEDSYGLYHVTNRGRGSYYDLGLTIASLLGKNITINPAKDSMFPGIGKKPMQTSIASVKLKQGRPWKEALKEYLLEGVKP